MTVISIFRWENWGPERFSDLFKVTLPVSGGEEFKSMQSDFSMIDRSHCAITPFKVIGIPKEF